jgi:hypothetical protein
MSSHIMWRQRYDTAADMTLMQALAALQWEVRESSIAPYLQQFSAELSENPKVFPDDQFSLGVHWVRTDFMRRLRLQYPTPGETAGGRYILIVDSNTPVARQPDAAKPTPTRSGWKFWR